MNAGNLFRAARGPVMLITVGVLFALDHSDIVNFDRTWPAIIIIFGLMKLMERMGGAEAFPPYAAQPYATPPYAGPQQPVTPPPAPISREGNPQ